MRNLNRSTVRSNFQLGCEIDQMGRWYITLNERLTVIEKQLNHRQPDRDPEKQIGAEQLLADESLSRGVNNGKVGIL
jgi:hypothetical protein